MSTQAIVRKVLIVFVFIVGLLSGCNWVKPTINPMATVEITMTPTFSPAIAGNITFENASFPCPSDQVREPGQGYPYPIRQDTGEQKSVSELEEFCSRMKQRFSQSGMNVTEAAKIFSLLKADNNDKLPWLHNECYGMPVCEPEPFVLDRQVMIKKIDDKEYELFYYFIGCGTNYHHLKIFMEQNRIARYEIFERWSESFPC